MSMMAHQDTVRTRDAGARIPTADGPFVVTLQRERATIEFSPGSAVRPTEAQLQLLSDVEGTIRVLHGLYSAPEEHQQLLDRLTALQYVAKAGLEGHAADHALGRRMLTDFQQGILDREAGRTKNRYLWTLGRMCLTVGVPCLLVGIVALKDAAKMHLRPEVPYGALLLAACTAGVWVSFGARKVRYTFTDLARPEADDLAPVSRVAFAAILTLGLAMLLASGVAKVTVGQLNTANVFTSAQTAVIVGFLCGFSEQVLAGKLADQATKLIGTKPL